MRFIGRRSLVGAAIVLLLLIVNSGIAFYSIAMIGEDSRQMWDSYSAHLTVAQLFSLLQDAETGQRGYLLTSDDAYLAPYRDAIVRLQSSLDQLSSSAAYQPELAQHLPTLQGLIGQKLDELRQTVDLHRQGRHDEAIAMMRSGEGKHLMDMIRGEIARIDQLQQQRLGQAQSALAQRFVLVQAGLSVALVVSLGLLGLVVSLISRDMRERARVAADLARERGVLQATITSIGDGLIATDVQGHITFMNPVAEHLTGWLQDEAQGKPLDEVFRIISEGTRQTVENPVAKVLRSGMVAGLANHTLLIAKDGRERSIDDSGAPIHDQGQQLLGVVLVFRDITERYAAEAALRSSEARYRALADTIAPLVFSMDAGGAITYLNQRCYDYAGHSGAGSLSAFWRDLIHPADRADVLAGWDQSRCAGQLFESEYRLRRADGCYRWFLNRIVPTRQADGSIIGWFGSCTDIDDQRRAVDHEHFLAEASYTMVRTTQYEQALDAVARLAVPAVADLCIIQVLDDEGALAHTAFAHTDPERAALIQPIQRFHLPFAASADPAARARLIADITQEMIARSESSPAIRDLALRFGPKAVIFAPMSLRHQSLGGVMLAIDTVERSYGPGDLHMAEELARRLSLGIDNARLFREAQVAITVRDEFLSIASHELRTPLTALLGYGEMLQRRAEENPAFLERDRYAIRVMLTRIEHLYKMVSSMLDLSRLQSRQLMIECTSVRICPLIRRVIFEAQTVHSKSRVIFEGCEEQEIVIEGDELRLEQVFQNLLENALKYSSDPDPVIFSLEEHESYVLISVADHGIGIPKEDLPQLFQRFYRASNIDGRRVSGMGLGLYVVKEIVSLHHGTITVTSEEGKGSTFTVRLPKSGMSEEWPQ